MAIAIVENHNKLTTACVSWRLYPNLFTRHLCLVVKLRYNIIFQTIYRTPNAVDILSHPIDYSRYI